MTDLGTLPGDARSLAFWINDPGQIVGASCLQSCRAVLWQHGTAIDLNGRIPADSPLSLRGAFGINSHGTIVGLAFNKGTHAFVAFVASPNGETTTETQTRSTSSRSFVLPESARQQLHRLPAFARRGLLE